MNILPHKSWHVRTKKNIARVRADEKKAAEEEREVKRRQELAVSEARINLLRSLKKSRTETVTSNISNNPDEHVNFFKEVEDGKFQTTNDNPERTQEIKEEKEKYEKSIGYLTYLGQDTNEILRKKDWYERVPDRTDKFNEDGTKVEVNLKSKLLNDPLTLMHKYMRTSSSHTPTTKIDNNPEKLPKYESVLSESIKNYRLKKKKNRNHSSSSSDSKHSSSRKHKKKSKKNKRKKSHKHASDSSDDKELKRLKLQKLEALRVERLQREKNEREKAENLMRKLRGETEKPKEPPQAKPLYKQKYNSQFNPEFARQNQD